MAVTACNSVRWTSKKFSFPVGAQGRHRTNFTPNFGGSAGGSTVLDGRKRKEGSGKRKSDKGPATCSLGLLLCRSFQKLGSSNPQNFAVPAGKAWTHVVADFNVPLHHKFSNLHELLQGDLSKEINQGVQSLDFMDRPCNCQHKKDGLCACKGNCCKQIIICKAMCLVTGKHCI